MQTFLFTKLSAPKTVSNKHTQYDTQQPSYNVHNNNINNLPWPSVTVTK